MLGAASGVLDINADNLTNGVSAPLTSDGALNLTLGGLNNAGIIYSAGAQTVSTQRDAVNSGTLQARATMDIQAARIDNTGNVSVTDGSAKLLGRDGLTNAGNICANDTLAVTSNGRVDNRGQIAAGKGMVQLAAQSLHNQSGQIVAQVGDLDIVTQQEIANEGGVIAANTGSAHVRATSISQTEAAQIFANDQLDLTAVTLGNDAKGQIHSQNTLKIEARDALHNAGFVSALYGMNILVGTQFANDAGGVIAVQDGQLSFNGATASIINAGQIGNQRSGHVTLLADSVQNSGVKGAVDGAQVNVVKRLGNTGSLIATQGPLELVADELINAGSLGTGQAGTMTINVR